MKTSHIAWFVAPLVLAASAWAIPPKPTYKPKIQLDPKLVKLKSMDSLIANAKKIPPAAQKSKTAKAQQMGVPPANLGTPFRLSAAHAVVPGRGYLNTYDLTFYPERDLFLGTNGQPQAALYLFLQNLNPNKRYLVECEVRASGGSSTVRLKTQENAKQPAESQSGVPNGTSRIVSVVLSPSHSTASLSLDAMVPSAWATSYCEITPQQ